jgi:hypothetical protein
VARKPNFAKPDPEALKASTQASGSLECASRTIRIDHLADKADSTVVPCFLDTKSTTEAVVELLRYHGQAERLADVGLIQNLAEAAKKSSMVLIGINPALSYVVVDNARYEALKALPEGGDGSDLETCAVILDIAFQMRRLATAEGKGDLDLVFNIDED